MHAPTRPSGPFPLSGLRVIESALLGPGAAGMHLADLGAEVIKVEPPGTGDYVRQMAFPIVDGISLLHWHLNRGKRSLALDLRTPDGVAVYLDLVRVSDVVIEAMRPGALARRGLTFARMAEANPRIVFCSISGYGASGPYKDMPSHGIAYDAWAGVARPTFDADGTPSLPSYTAVGINAGPLYAALGILAGVIRARETGRGCQLEVAQCDAAAAFNWNGIEGNKAYERPENEVTGNDGDGKGPRRPVGDDSMKDAVRYQYYRSSDGIVLFMASEREFWKNFCEGVGRPDLFAANPGARVADHARGNVALRRELAAIFATRTTAEWVEFGARVNTPICPVNTVKTITRDPHFQHRLPLRPYQQHGTDLMPCPINLLGESLPVPARAPVEVGRDTDAVLRDVLGYDEARIAALRASKALG
ncbi:MAG TPA: CaiB/BaiF CoA-transferase family protein [Candidatus Limnocylindria bacterium]|nr:CaiB/BaiF CoA-transferase family protein [Candidatus Limnocylindria bacterium]